MDIALILSRKFQDSEWFLDGQDYSGLEWLSSDDAPTEAQLEALWPEVEYEQVYEQVQKQRQAAYAETSDPLFFEYQRGDATEEEWLAAVQAVKDAHPYPPAV